MTNQEKINQACAFALGAAQVPVTAANVATLAAFLDVDADGIVKVFGGKVESNHAAYVLAPNEPWAPRTCWDIMATGIDKPVSFAKLVEDLRLANVLP